MASIALENVTKRFGATAAVDDVTLSLADGEFVAVLGPSGCGKTTLLRLIAGFERVDAGAVRLGGTLASAPDLHVPPEERRVGIVFQSYALWPHMDVARNVGYPLDVARIARAEHDRRVAAALDAVGLSGYERRRPNELSGGQRQRVALARCLVMEPALVLLDEPLANLDVHLRASMLEEFASFHRRTGATMLYITHDQAEAMALAQRIAVMDRGRVVQVAAPRTLYREPTSTMVGAFIGRGAIVPAAVLKTVDAAAEVEICGARARVRCRPGQETGPAFLCLRPEDLEIVAADAPDAIRARILRSTFRGGYNETDLRPEADPQIRLHVHTADGHARVGDTVGLMPRDGWVIPTREPAALSAPMAGFRAEAAAPAT